jgi:HK97 family phage portal protein
MSLLTRARWWLAQAAVKAGGLAIVPSWVTASVIEPSFRLLVGEAYRKNAVFFACLSALAFDFPEPPMRVYADDDDDAPALPNHPLRGLLRRPNPLMGEGELWATTIAYAGLGGNSYWHKVRNRGRRVVEVWPYHAGQIIPVPSSDPDKPWIERYDFDRGDGTLIPVPVEDIVHFRWPTPDPTQPWQAQPPLAAAAAEVDADNEATRYLRALMKNDATPRTVIIQSKDRFMDDDEVRRARQQWRERYGGDNRGDVAILEAGAAVQRLGLNLQELAFEALHRVPEKRIAAALRVPLSVAGIGDDPTYANSEEAYKRYTRSTLVPLWRIFASEVESSLGEEFGGVVARFDLRKVTLLQEDETQRWTRVLAAFTAGVIPDEDEARGLLGLPKLTTQQREALKPPPAPAPSPAALPAPAAPAAASENMPADMPADGASAQRGFRPALETKAARAAQRAARALQRVRQTAARRLESAVGGWFDDLAKTVIGRAEKAGRPAVETKELPGLDELLEDDDFLTLEKLVKRYAVEVVSASWETWNEALGADVAFSLSDPAVVAAQRSAGQRITDIAETTRSTVQDLLVYGAEQGWTLGQLVAGTDEHPGLRDLVEQSYKGRARTIARTELGEAQQAAAVARFAAAKVTQVYIADNGQDDPDEACAQLNGTVQTLAWAKENALAHPNCTRCFSPYFD